MTLTPPRDQRGAGAIGCLFLVALVAGGIYAGFQLGLPRLRHSSFEDRMSESYVHFQKQPADAIRDQVIQIASDFDIELRPEQVKVGIMSDKMTIDVSYEKQVDLRVWKTTIPFELHRSGPY